MSIAGEVGDHDPAGLGLPPVVVERQAERLRAPDDRLGVERLADAGDEAQTLEGRSAARQLGAGLHQHADRGRRGVPDGDPLRPARMPYQRSASNSPSSTMLVTPLRERRDDAVRRAGHPAGVGGAPEDVVRVQVERELAGGVVRDHRLVHVHRALRRAGRAAGEVQQRQVLGSVGGISNRSLAAAISAAKSRVPRHRVGRRPPTSSTCSRPGSASRIGATLRR